MCVWLRCVPAISNPYYYSDTVHLSYAICFKSWVVKKYILKIEIIFASP